MGVIKAVCISEKKGTAKVNVGSGLLIEDFGIQGDAHAGSGHRQVSILSYEKIRDFKAEGAPVEDGSFGENLIAADIDLSELSVGTRLKCGEALLEVSQIGKECHSSCAIGKTMGRCIMPTEGIFAKVIKGGRVKSGDYIGLLPITL